MAGKLLIGGPLTVLCNSKEVWVSKKCGKVTELGINMTHSSIIVDHVDKRII